MDLLQLLNGFERDFSDTNPIWYEWNLESGLYLKLTLKFWKCGLWA